MILRLCLVLVLLPVVAGAQESGMATSDSPEIRATGSAEIHLPPDRASLTVSVIIRNRSATEAGRINAQRINSVVEALRRGGIPDSSLATKGFSIRLEEREYDAPAAPPEEPPVYVATNSVSIVLTDMSAIGRIVDSVLAAGASEVDGISYRSTAAAEGRRRAIAQAVREAQADAEAAAAAAGGRLGNLIEIVISPTLIRGAAAANLYGSSTHIMVPSDVSVAATATVRYRFTR